MAKNKSVAVIGAGLAGATTAYRLNQAGFNVTVFEQQHKVGGRLASARLLDMPVDLGAPVIGEGQAGDESDLVKLAQELKVAEPWLAHVSDFNLTAMAPHSFFVVREHSRILVRQMLQGIERRNDTEVKVVWPDREGVLLRDADGIALGYYDLAVIATPGPAATGLLDALPRFAQLAKAASYRPQWTLQIAFNERPAALAGIDLVRGRHPVLKSVIRNSSKPGRKGELWCLEARYDWSEQHIGSLPGAVSEALLGALEEVCGDKLPKAASTQTTLWRLAYCQSNNEDVMIWDRHYALGVCGDWLGGEGVDGAYKSGEALAARIINETGRDRRPLDEAPLNPKIGQTEFYKELEAGD